VREITTRGLRRYWNSTGFGFAENSLMWVIFTLLLVVGLCRAADSDVEEYFVAFAVICGWMYLFVLLLGWKLTGPFVVMIFRMLRQDVARFIIIYVNVLIGLSAAVFAIEEDDTENGPALFGNRIETYFLAMFGNFDFNSFNGQLRATWLGTILLIAYIILVTILLLNLLIAMMANTYTQISERSQQEWLLAYAQIITEIEKEMTGGAFRGDNLKYWVNYKNARYMLCQEEDPTYFLRESNEERDRKAVLANPSATLKMLDSNFDGVIDQYELNMAKNKPGANLRLKDAGMLLASVDADGDGKITEAELKMAADEAKLDELVRVREQAIAVERAAQNRPEAMDGPSSRPSIHQNIVRQK